MGNIKFYSIYFPLLALLAGEGILTAKLPDYVGRCSLSSPDLAECFKKSIPAAIRSFKDGAPELGIPSLEPLRIPQMIIGEGGSPVNVVQNFSNLEIYGMTVATSESAEADPKILTVKLRSITDRIEMLGDYAMSGRILVLTVKGSGKCNITIIKARSEHSILTEKYEKKGVTYLRVKEYLVSMEPERIYYNFENAFAGDERLSAEINKVLNENWKEVYTDISAGYDKSYGLVFKNIANNFFSRVPFDDVFLP